MSETSSHATMTGLLRAGECGDREALNALFPLVYQELRTLARQQRRRWHGDITLDTTALVHEVYLKLAGQEEPRTQGRAHFCAVAARV